MSAGDLVMIQGLLLQLWAPLQFLGWFYRWGTGGGGQGGVGMWWFAAWWRLPGGVGGAWVAAAPAPAPYFYSHSQWGSFSGGVAAVYTSSSCCCRVAGWRGMHGTERLWWLVVVTRGHRELRSSLVDMEDFFAILRTQVRTTDRPLRGWGGVRGEGGYECFWHRAHTGHIPIVMLVLLQSFLASGPC
jgi:hypothetical protein